MTINEPMTQEQLDARVVEISAKKEWGEAKIGADITVELI